MDLKAEYQRMQYSHQVTADELVKTSLRLRHCVTVIAQIRDFCQNRASEGLGLIPEEVIEIIDDYDVR